MMFAKRGEIIRERHAPFCRFPRTGTIEKDTTHQGRGHAKEVRSILPAEIVRVHKAQINFINEGGCLERRTPPFRSHPAARHPAQFLVHQWRKPIRRQPLAPCFSSFVISALDAGIRLQYQRSISRAICSYCHKFSLSRVMADATAQEKDNRYAMQFGNGGFRCQLE